jgi:hypothetical protein
VAAQLRSFIWLMGGLKPDHKTIGEFRRKHKGGIKKVLKQFARQIEQANEVSEEPCKVGCADAGYADTEELQKIDGQGIKVIVPSQRQALHEEERPLNKSHFTYDKDRDCY